MKIRLTGSDEPVTVGTTTMHRATIDMVLEVDRCAPTMLLQIAQEVLKFMRNGGDDALMHYTINFEPGDLDAEPIQPLPHSQEAR